MPLLHRADSVREKVNLYNLLFISATIVAGEIAEIECADSKKAPSRDSSQDDTFLLWIRANTARQSRR